MPILLLFKGMPYDIFHLHACSYWGMFPAVSGIITGKLLKKKIVLTWHSGGAEDYFVKHSKFVKFFLSKTDKNIVLSGFLEKIFDKHGISYITIPNIMNINDGIFRKRDSISPNFISIRSLSPAYNIPCIIKAFHIVVKQIPSATLQILADGESRSELELYVKENEIPNITFVGRVSNHQIYTYLNKADIFLPSPIIDNQPMSVLECFNAGLLAISSNVGGVPYLIENFKTGLLFKSNDYEELSNKMLWTINNQEKAKQIILKAKQELQKYSSDVVIQQIINNIPMASMLFLLMLTCRMNACKKYA